MPRFFVSVLMHVIVILAMALVVAVRDRDIERPIPILASISDDDGARGTEEVSFFGATSNGKSFVFVVDNSNSMKGGRFETALSQLARAVQSLGPKQQFSVIFYSDQAYGLFHPEPFPGLIPATDANKQRLVDWLYTVEMCLNTRGEEAMKMAIAPKPDVIQILGDGAFTDKAAEVLTAAHDRKTAIQTFGMQVDPKGELQLAAIAQANGGTFRMVQIDPAAANSAKQNPIPSNKKRGSVWGLSLPQDGKKK